MHCVCLKEFKKEKKEKHVDLPFFIIRKVGTSGDLAMNGLKAVEQGVFCWLAELILCLVPVQYMLSLYKYQSF